MAKLTATFSVAKSNFSLISHDDEFRNLDDLEVNVNTPTNAFLEVMLANNLIARFIADTINELWK